MTINRTGAEPVGNPPMSSVREAVTEPGPTLLFETELDHVAAAGSKPGIAGGANRDLAPSHCSA